MGFIGSINDKLRKFFSTHAGLLEGRDIYIGCSGNFTVEQIISRRCENVTIHSNDISLYALAKHLISKGISVIHLDKEMNKLYATELDPQPSLL